MTHRTRIAFAAIALCIATAASAGPEIEERSVTLRVDASGDPQALYGELRRVAERECRSQAVIAYRHARHERQCREEFVAEAVQAIDRPELTALHEAETGVRVGVQVASQR